MEIIPAILPKDFAEITEKAEAVKDFVKTVQIDICDGHLVPSFTWPYKKHDENFEKILTEEMGMPFWEDLDYEFDLIIKNPEQEIEKWVKAGAKRIIAHYNSTSTENLLAIKKEWSGLIELGIAFKGEHIDIISKDIEAPESESLIRNFDFVQIMGISKIGFQGQKFDEKSLDCVRLIKEKLPEKIVSVDGGVTGETAKLLRNEGVDRLVAGSAIFASENVPKAIKGLSLI